MSITTLTLLPFATAGLGWLIGRHFWPESKSPEGANSLPADYFVGLNYLINEQPDKAVDVFIRLLEVDSETIETHLALGSLFRRRGEVDRAIRIHQNLIARPQLSKNYRAQALEALGQDYLHAGVLDRAEKLFHELVEMGEKNEPSLRSLLHIYQQEKDWLQAIETAQKLAHVTGETMHPIIAQYYCEIAEQVMAEGAMHQAQRYLKRARAIDPNCVRASLMRGNIEYQQGEFAEAIRFYKLVPAQDTSYMPMVLPVLSECHKHLHQEDAFSDYLHKILAKEHLVSVVTYLAEQIKAKSGHKAAIEFVTEQIKINPSLTGLNYLIELYCQSTHGDIQQKLSLLHGFMQQLVATKPAHQCHQCGFSGQSMYWLCPSCHHWNTVKPIK